MVLNRLPVPSNGASLDRVVYGSLPECGSLSINLTLGIILLLWNHIRFSVQESGSCCYLTPPPLNIQANILDIHSAGRECTFSFARHAVSWSKKMVNRTFYVFKGPTLITH